MKKYIVVILFVFISCKSETVKKSKSLFVISGTDTVEIVGFGDIDVSKAHFGTYGYNDTIAGNFYLRLLKTIPMAIDTAHNYSFGIDTIYTKVPLIVPYKSKKKK